MVQNPVAGTYVKRGTVVAVKFAAAPALVNYLFFPQPASAITTTTIPFGPDLEGSRRGALFASP